MRCDRIIFFRCTKIFNSSFLTVEKRQWRTNGNTDLLPCNIGLLNNRALFDTAFDLQSCLQDLSRSFRCTVCIRKKVLYASSPALVSALPTVVARCDVFKSLLLRYTDRALPRGWSTQSTIRRTLSRDDFRHEHVATPRRHDSLRRPRL